MARDKQFWARLTKSEREDLVALEAAAKRRVRSSPYYPDDMGECPCCGNPTSCGLCVHCDKIYSKLLKKAEGQEVE